MDLAVTDKIRVGKYEKNIIDQDPLVRTSLITWAKYGWPLRTIQKKLLEEHGVKVGKSTVQEWLQKLENKVLKVKEVVERESAQEYLQITKELRVTTAATKALIDKLKKFDDEMERNLDLVNKMVRDQWKRYEANPAEGIPNSEMIGNYLKNWTLTVNNQIKASKVLTDQYVALLKYSREWQEKVQPQKVMGSVYIMQINQAFQNSVRQGNFSCNVCGSHDIKFSPGKEGENATNPS